MARTTLPIPLKLPLPLVADDFARVQALEASLGALDEAAARFVLTVAEAVNRPCTHKQAEDFAAILIGCFPRNEAGDPDVYIRGLVSVLEPLPPDIAVTVVDHLTKTCRGLPTRAEAFEAARSLSERRRMLASRARFTLRLLEEAAAVRARDAEVARDRAARARWTETEWRAFYRDHGLPLPAHLVEDGPAAAPPRTPKTGRAPAGARPVAGALDGVLGAIAAGTAPPAPPDGAAAAPSGAPRGTDRPAAARTRGTRAGPGRAPK